MPLAQTGVAEYQPLLKRMVVAKLLISLQSWLQMTSQREVDNITLAESHGQMAMAKGRTLDRGFWTFWAN